MTGSGNTRTGSSPLSSSAAACCSWPPFFVAGSVAAGLISTAADAGPAERLGSVWPFGRQTATTLATVYGLRMAAVFTISATTIASRLRLVPRWLALLGYATAVSLLFGAGFVPWLELLFPAWVFVLSVHILVAAFRFRAGRDRRPRMT